MPGPIALEEPVENRESGPSHQFMTRDYNLQFTTLDMGGSPGWGTLVAIYGPCPKGMPSCEPRKGVTQFLHSKSH
jgi:hypothetical protein